MRLKRCTASAHEDGKQGPHIKTHESGPNSPTRQDLLGFFCLRLLFFLPRVTALLFPQESEVNGVGFSFSRSNNKVFFLFDM